MGRQVVYTPFQNRFFVSRFGHSAAFRRKGGSPGQARPVKFIRKIAPTATISRRPGGGSIRQSTAWQSGESAQPVRDQFADDQGTWATFLRNCMCRTSRIFPGPSEISHQSEKVRAIGVYPARL